jgi:hypothetical protein
MGNVKEEARGWLKRELREAAKQVDQWSAGMKKQDVRSLNRPESRSETRAASPAAGRRR